jgi:hypothetical protein
MPTRSGGASDHLASLEAVFAEHEEVKAEVRFHPGEGVKAAGNSRSRLSKSGGCFPLRAELIRARANVELASCGRTPQGRRSTSNRSELKGT